MQIFMKLGLVEPLDRTAAFYMSNIELLIGQSSTEGERKRRARRRFARSKRHCRTAVADKRPPEIEIEKEIDIELEIKREGEIKTGQTAPAPYGRYENVFLSKKELAELQAGTSRQMGILHRPSIRLYRFQREEIPEPCRHYSQRGRHDDAGKGEAPKKGIPDYSCKEGESL